MILDVLFVCTGNICRSPAGERLLRSAVADAQESLAVSSSGTHGLTGRGIDGPTALALRELGVDPDGHEARRLDRDQVTDAGLVLTATVAQRKSVLSIEPAALNRVFTLREFTRLAATAQLTGDPLERIVAVAGQRGRVEPAARGGDDIADPFGASAAFARSVVEVIRDEVAVAAAALGLS